MTDSTNPTGESLEREMDRVQAPLVESLRRFRAGLATNAAPPIYMFFTGGLLHWVFKALEFLPREVNLVLLGAGLSDEEKACLARRTDRPFHAIDQEVDDRTAWELLWAVERGPFGWLDVDAFVLDPDLMGEMSEVPEGVAFNCLWAHDTGRGVKLPYPHFVFVGGELAADEELRALGVTPGSYSYEGGQGRRRFPWACDRRLDGELRSAVDRVIGPPEERDEPYFNERPFFEPLQVLALAAYDRGYRLQEVRTLGDRRDEDHWNEQIIHVSSVSYVVRPDFPWGELPLSPRRRYLMILVSDYLLANDLADELPEAYRAQTAERRARVEAIAEKSFSDERLRTAARALMTHCVSEEAIVADERWRFVRATADPVAVA
ncbi:MAG TPA: hypothetical protein VHQ65_07265 [Thermoanaerobaculia bacterium]|nr:hypothetical protein [Thermoanaerobaculia bacterium]